MVEFLAPIPGWEERGTIKASKFSDAEKAFILKQGADGIPVADICTRALGRKRKAGRRDAHRAGCFDPPDLPGFRGRYI